MPEGRARDQFIKDFRDLERTPAIAAVMTRQFMDGVAASMLKSRQDEQDTVESMAIVDGAYIGPRRQRR